ncbi:MAG: acyl--CoA ligase [Actinobacteria bacterium]|nr:acyl--CoA ligase [Actinomycetota bacterium]
MVTFQDIKSQLTAPGQQFETTTEVIDGIEQIVYANRFGALREVAQFSQLAHGEKDFIVYGDRRITFNEFFAEANAMSKALQAAGVAKGDRVSILAQNCPEWCLTFWSTVNIGAVLVGLNGWWTNDEILYGLEDSGSKVLVADRKRFERIAADVDNLDFLERVYLIDCDPADVTPEGSDGSKLFRFSDLIAEAETGDPGFPDTPIDEADYAVIFYTSGTTGRPKGAISTHRSMICNLQNTVFVVTASAMLLAANDPEAAERASGGGAQPVALFTSPLFHVSGCHTTMVVGTLAGMRLAMIEGKFEPEKALALIEDEKVSTWSTVPTMVWRVCEYEDRHKFDTSTVTSVGFGGSPSADELQRRIRETFPNVAGTTNAYGLTESSSAATVLVGDDALRKADTVGLPMPTVQLGIADPNGGLAPEGATGEVLIKSPLLMAGYWNKPEATASTIIDGWLHTGDVGFIDDEGFLHITDRSKDMIIRGGENVYCVEIENCLVENPKIADAAIIGVPHDSLGEEVKAVIEVAAGESISEAEVKEWVASHLAAFKVPTYVEFHDGKLPRNASGKLLKNILRGAGEVSMQETM